MACVVAALIRIVAARGELWLDEVWSIRLVQESAHSLRDIVFNIKHDNNHFINSFVIYILGPGRAEWLYRAPAVLAGTLAVLVAAWTYRRKNIITISAAVVLTGFSYLLVQYSSEARGYAYEILFSILAFAMLSEPTLAQRQQEQLPVSEIAPGLFVHVGRNGADEM